MADIPDPETLRHQVEDIQEIATLPHVMQRILDTVSDEAASAHDLSKEIAADPSLTAKLLKIVNSAYYGYHREIILLTEAIVVLGFDEVKRMSLAIGVIGMFGRDPARERERVQFWSHCFHTAAIAELLEREAGFGGRGAFTAGLLHDLGRAVLDQFFHPLYELVTANQAETNRTAVVVEAELLGVTHAEIGAWLANRWGLPALLETAMRYHHAPGERPEDALLVPAVHVADVLAHRIAEATDDTAPKRGIDPATLDALRFERARLAPLMKAATERMAQDEHLIAGLVTV